MFSTSTLNTTEKVVCHHCGESCPDDMVWFQEKTFCCHGCQMVFELLSEHGLSSFYHIEDRPGINQKNKKAASYDWLADQDVLRQLVDYQDENRIRLRLYLPQIHCSACIFLLENLYKFNEGIELSKVNFLKREIQITYNKKKVNLPQIAKILASIGYPPEINLGDLNEKKAPKNDKKLNYQLGVAGFAFGNIMLLSFPEYLGLEQSVFQQIFGYLNVLLILPVVFYCAKPYLQSAWQSLRQGHLNIDVPISIGIFTLLLRSTYEIFSQTGAGYLDSLAGLVFFLLIGKWFQQRTYHRLSFERDYKSYFPIAATRLQGGNEESIVVNKLKVGDRILIRHGEIIPADGILQSGKAAIDYSFVTGEAEPIARTIGDQLYAGGRQMGEAIEVLLRRSVSQSYLTGLWNEEAFQKESTNDISSISSVVGKYFTYVILLVALTTLLFWLPRDVPLAINAFTAVLIIACPCALALSIPFTLGNTLRLLAKRKFYLKNTEVIERMNQIDCLVFDKTGTLTTNEGKALIYKGDDLPWSEQQAIRSLVRQSSHPISRKIEGHFSDTSWTEVLDFEEEIGQGIRGFCNSLFVEIGKSESGEKGTVIKVNGQIRGVLLLKNQYRSGLEDLLQNWQKDFELFVLSGDSDEAKTYLSQFIPKENLHFQQRPKDKLQFIEELQRQGKKVLMFGDGLNDAGALKQSDVGIVLAENTNNFTPASDAILAAQHFACLPSYWQLIRRSIQTVYGAYILAFIYNLIGLSFAVQGLLSPVIAAILMPLSSVTIVAFGVLVTNVMGRD